MKPQKYSFKAVKRNTIPAPIPYIITEKDLPSNHKILVFLPHSDDGRYFGGSLLLLNKTNDVKLIVMSPGYHGVHDDISKNEKIKKRWQEALSWSKTLGFEKERIIDFRADETYSKSKITNIDMQKLHWFIEYEKPTMIFIPHISDTAQSINYNTRRMAIHAITCWIADKHKESGRKKVTFIIEYPTNHIPLIPPSDKNLIIMFTDESIPETKHNANKCHESQSQSGFVFAERMIEAFESVSEAEDVYQMNQHRRYARYLSGIEIDSNKSRGEQLGVTKIIVKDSGPSLVEERIKFPLNKTDLSKWKL